MPWIWQGKHDLAETNDNLSLGIINHLWAKCPPPQKKNSGSWSERLEKISVGYALELGYPFYYSSVGFVSLHKLCVE